MRVAVGITTYNRPEMFEKCAKSVAKHLSGLVSSVYVYDDASDLKHRGAYKRGYSALEDSARRVSPADNVNRGVGHAKNSLLHQMLADDADWLFLLEDDIRILDGRAVTGYIQAAEESGLHHLSFAHHGPANVGGLIETAGPVEYYRHAIGAWCLYSRKCLETVGLFDENFHNAWEHVEHSLRLAQAGFTTGPYRWADATGSERWLSELPGSIERSSIRPRQDWQSSIVDGLDYWRREKPDTYQLMFGPGTPLEAWAARTLGARV